MSAAGDSTFLFITGVVRSLENRLLRKGIIESMLRADSVSGIAAILRSTGYSEYPETSIDPFDPGAMIKRIRGELYSFAEKYSCDTGIGELFRLDYDYHNMKLLLKSSITGGDAAPYLSTLGSIETGTLMEIFSNEEYRNLPSVMSEAVSSAIESYYLTKRSFTIDLQFDRFLFRDLICRASASGSGLVLNYFRRRIDTVNIMALLRAGRESYYSEFSDLIIIDGGFVDSGLFREGSSDYQKTLAVIADRYDFNQLGSALVEKVDTVYHAERECGKLLMKELEPASFMISGVEPLFAFLCRADYELKTVGMLAASVDGDFRKNATDAVIAGGGNV